MTGFRLPPLAPADLERPYSLYHNLCLHLVLSSTLITLGILYIFRPVDLADIRVRAIIGLIPICYSSTFTVFIFLKRKADIALSHDRNFYWLALYAGICTFAFISLFFGVDPASPIEQGFYKYLMSPILIPYALTSFIFFILCALSNIKP